MANTKTKWTEKVSKVLFKSKHYKDHIYLANETKLNEKNYTKRIIKRIYFRTKKQETKQRPRERESGKERVIKQNGKKVRRVEQKQKTKK